MMDIVVLGTGGHGRETLEVLEAINAQESRFEILGFLDDRLQPAEEVHGYPVLGDRFWLEFRSGSTLALAIGVGSPAARARVAGWAAEHHVQVPALVHPAAIVSRRARLGEGVLVMSDSRISIDTEIGAFAHLNHGCSVSHDCVLGRFATLAPGVTLAGNVVLEEGAEMGVGAVAIPGARIGAWSMIGAGAVVTGSVLANVVAVGIPAAVRRQREVGWHLTP
ncbi:MAG: sugar O-acyltransferase, sialic acid O-acetyltransferase NeuD family [Gemmatimonadetes bacterium]|nr:sugar O-acyltransferase, sialic acid O-acetyltransferase NeuD family [Gemmatimonadota bacterium]